MSNTTTISVEDIREGISENLRPFIRVAQELQSELYPVVHAFWEATKLIAPVI